MAAAVQDFARQVFSDETDQLEFLALLLAPGLLESTHVAEAVRRILTSALHRTLIVYGRNFDRVYQTLEHHLQIVLPDGFCKGALPGSAGSGRRGFGSSGCLF